MMLASIWLSPTNQRFEIEPQFDWHELNLSADFVRWTSRRVETNQSFSYKNKKYQAKVTIYDTMANDMIRMEVKTKEPFSIRSVLFFEPWRKGSKENKT